MVVDPGSSVAVVVMTRRRRGRLGRMCRVICATNVADVARDRPTGDDERECEGEEAPTHLLASISNSCGFLSKASGRPFATVDGMEHKHGHYRHLLFMTALSFASMYVLMYAMVDSAENVYSNINQLYMAGLMTAPMIVIELAVMRTMYSSRRSNALIVAATVILGTVCFVAIRQQAGVSDRQFLRSMIPHHASALLMCNEAPLGDPEIRKLCDSILRSQQSEIDWMRTKLTRLPQ